MSRVSTASFALTTLLALTLFPQFCAAAQMPPAMTAAQRQVMAAVTRFLNGVNANDGKTAIAACAPQTSIIDEFPPHEWQGAAACANWFHDFTADNKAEGITGGIATLGTPARIAVTGTTAYVVAPSTFAYKQRGKPVTESGSTFTVALRRIGGSWRITGWAWSAR